MKARPILALIALSFCLIAATAQAQTAPSIEPGGVASLGTAITEPAWKNKPSWYLVATADRMIPPDAQRQMSTRAGATVVEEEGSHSIYVSKPDVVAALIETAAREAAVGAA